MLSRRALAGWAGTDRVAAIPRRLEALRARPVVPASAPLALLVAGLDVDEALVRRGLPELSMLLERGLVERVAGERVRSRVAIVPVGSGVLVCDRADAADEEELVAWPDDSSHHLAGAIPAGRRARWLDLGCGSAFAQLARPELADELVGLDANPRAVRYARLGAELGGIARLAIHEGRIGEVSPGEAELVTCNAPMPYTNARAMWRCADGGFFDALWPAVRASLAPGGLAVVHAARAAIPDELPGERVLCAYAPDFAVLWWRPDAPARRVAVARTLTAERPHVDARDRDDALASC